MRTVVIVHGLGSSPGRVAHMGAAFQRLGYNVVYIDYNSNLVNDYEEVSSQMPDNPDVVIGHSQGGRVVNEMANRGQLPNSQLFAVNSPFVPNKNSRVEFLQTLDDPFGWVDPFLADAQFTGGHTATAAQMNYILSKINTHSGQSNSLATRTENLNRNSSTFSSFK